MLKWKDALRRCQLRSYPDDEGRVSFGDSKKYGAFEESFISNKFAALVQDRREGDWSLHTDRQ